MFRVVRFAAIVIEANNDSKVKIVGIVQENFLANVNDHITGIWRRNELDRTLLIVDWTRVARSDLFRATKRNRLHIFNIDLKFVSFFNILDKLMIYD